MIRKSVPLLLLLVSVPALAQEPSPERVRWAENALAVRSIQPADEDFSDLMPLARLIGTARVVQLGESTHGDGSTFHASGPFTHHIRFSAMAVSRLYPKTGLSSLTPPR